MASSVRRFDGELCRNYARASRLEWVLTNGIGGFAMGTVVGNNTRRYHGHLVAATQAPEVRTVLLAGIEAYVSVGANSDGLSSNQYVGTVHPEGYKNLEYFTVGESAEWVWNIHGNQVSKRVSMHAGANAVTISYSNLSAVGMTLSLRPLVSHKFYHDNFRVTDFYPEILLFPEDRTVVSHQGIRLAIEHPGATRTPTTGWYYRFEHPRESERGLDAIDDLFCPCELQYFLAPGESISIVAATEDGVEAIPGESELESSHNDIESELESAARFFIVETSERTGIIAGYPWFTDWGRDTMISLPGICLETGHVAQARAILESYALDTCDQIAGLACVITG